MLQHWPSPLLVLLLLNVRLAQGVESGNITSTTASQETSPTISSHDFAAWSKEFLTLLNVELSIGGQSLEKQLEPVFYFVQDLQENPQFVEWIKFLARLVSSATGMTYESGFQSGSKTPLNFLTSLIQHLVAGNNIEQSLEFLSNYKDSSLGELPSSVLSSLSNNPGKEKDLSRFYKMLYNAKRRHIKPKGSFETVKETAKTGSNVTLTQISGDILQIPTVNTLESLSDIQALKSILVDLIKTFRTEESTLPPIVPITHQTTETTTTPTTTVATTTTTATTTTVTTTTTTTTASSTTTSMSIEDRIAAMFPKMPTKLSVTSPPEKSKNLAAFLPPFKSKSGGKAKPWVTKKPKLIKTTTVYEKYPVVKTTTMPPNEDDFTTSTQKPFLPATLRTERSKVWAESDVTVCHTGRSCIFRGRIFVSGFEAVVSQDWIVIKEKLVKKLVPALRMIVVDSYLGSTGEKVFLKSIVPTSTSSAEMTFDVNIVGSAVAVDSVDLLGLINGADNRVFEPYRIERSLTEFHLVRPDARPHDKLVAAPYTAGTSGSSSWISPLTLAAIMGTIIVCGPLLIWTTHLVLRRLKSKNVKRQMKDQMPLIYSELEAAVTALKINNLYASSGKKSTVSKLSMFEFQKEKEQKMFEKRKADAAKKEAEAAKNEAETSQSPLIVPDVFIIDSPAQSLTSSLKKKKRQPRFLSNWFVNRKSAARKAVRFAVIGDKDDEEEDDDLTVVTPSFKRRPSSFRRFAQSLRIRHNRVVKSRTSPNRQNIEGFFNSAFVGDDGEPSSTSTPLQQHRRRETEFFRIDEDSIELSNFVNHQVGDEQHRYPVVVVDNNDHNSFNVMAEVIVAAHEAVASVVVDHAQAFHPSNVVASQTVVDRDESIIEVYESAKHHLQNEEEIESMMDHEVGDGDEGVEHVLVHRAIVEHHAFDENNGTVSDQEHTVVVELNSEEDIELGPDSECEANISYQVFGTI